jgi:hypothetical protein
MRSLKIQRISARCQCLIPVILATQKAEIRRIKVRSQPQAYISRDPISKNLITAAEWFKQ